MNLPAIPTDIQILLDCLRSRDELDLPEMEPLRVWIAETSGAQFMLSKALAANSELESALVDLQINVPKSSLRKVAGYVECNRNNLSEASDIDAEESTHNYHARPWYKNKYVQFASGFGSALAALLLVFVSVTWFLSDDGKLDPEVVSLSSIKWFGDTATPKTTWHPGWQENAGFDWPGELKMPPSAWTTISTEFDRTSVFDLKTQKSKARAMLFVFRTDLAFDRKYMNSSPLPCSNEEFCFGVSQNSGHTFVLTVNGATSDYQHFVDGDYQLVESDETNYSNSDWTSMLSPLWAAGNIR